MSARRNPRAGRGAWAWVLALSLAGCSTATEAPVEPGGSVPPAVVQRQPLPDLGPGATREDILDAVASWPPGHRYTAEGTRPEGWEWSGPDGLRLEAVLDGAVVRGGRLSRTWGEGAPPIDARRLPDGFVGRPLRELEAAAGRGLQVSREWGASGGAGVVLEEYKWAIHDRGVDTGLFLSVLARDGTVLAVDHRWSRR